MKKQVSVPFMVSGILFCVCLILANFLESKLIQIGPVQATGGLIIFPVAYILNDCIAEVWGFRKARLVIWTGFLMNFFAVIIAQLAIALPSAPYYEHQEAFATVFGATLRISIASFIAFLVGSFLNAYVMSKMKIASHGKGFGIRAIASTMIGESADSIIFFPIAFFGVIPFEDLLVLIVSQASLKTIYEIIILPVTYKVVKFVKKVDGSDVYDENISYNVLKIQEV
ncbi:MAG: queuosine precursor transporter [Bacteroidales bacterium]|nr:queuosine precursor transporter [Bacteroidales bacterium]